MPTDSYLHFVEVLDAANVRKAMVGCENMGVATEEFGYWRDIIVYPDHMRLIDNTAGDWKSVRTYTGKRN